MDEEKKDQNWLRTINVHKNYKLIVEVGRGTYGVVYKARCLKSNDYVAIKKILVQEAQDGFPITAIREIKLLQMLKHKNIIQLQEIIVSKPSIHNKYKPSTFLIFEYMNHDFYGLMQMKFNFTQPQIKCVIKQILKGVEYLHQKKIIHRDLKSANILYNNKGEVKIADFGLARQLALHPDMLYTNKVVTLWYRAPELLLGSMKYTTQIDMWSVGCIFAELLIKEILFQGDKEMRQLEIIYEICGSPEKMWPEIEKLKLYKEFSPKKYYPNRLKDFLISKYPEIEEDAIDLLQQMLTWNPKKRISAEQALEHQYFNNSVKCCEPNEMPEFKSECHESLIKNKKNVQKLEEEMKRDKNSSATTNPKDQFHFSNPQQNFYTQGGYFYQPSRGGGFNTNNNITSQQTSSQQFSSYQQKTQQKYDQKLVQKVNKLYTSAPEVQSSQEKNQQFQYSSSQQQQQQNLTQNNKVSMFYSSSQQQQQPQFGQQQSQQKQQIQNNQDQTQEQNLYKLNEGYLIKKKQNPEKTSSSNSSQLMSLVPTSKQNQAEHLKSSNPNKNDATNKNSNSNKTSSNNNINSEVDELDSFLKKIGKKTQQPKKVIQVQSNNNNNNNNNNKQ